MSIAGIRSSRGSMNYKTSPQDSYENNIKKQINALEEKMKTISNDEEKPAEQKTKERQSAQEQLQILNQELREYQIRKQQEEAEKKQEAIKEALASANKSHEETLASNGLDGKESGVMITLSATQEQLAGMVRLRTQLEGRQRTAETDEEKKDIQKKIDNLSNGIGQKINTAKTTISEYQKTMKKDDSQKPTKTESEKEEVFWTDLKKDSSSKQSGAGNSVFTSANKPFDNVSYVIK